MKRRHVRSLKTELHDRHLTLEIRNNIQDFLKLRFILVIVNVTGKSRKEPSFS